MKPKNPRKKQNKKETLSTPPARAAWRFLQCRSCVLCTAFGRQLQTTAVVTRMATGEDLQRHAVDTKAVREAPL